MDRNYLILLFVTIFIVSYLNALKCKVNDGPSEEEMKRVARSCMKRLTQESGENSSSDSNEDDNAGKTGFDHRDQMNSRNRGHFHDIYGYKYNRRSTSERNRQQQDEDHYRNSQSFGNSRRNYGSNGNSRQGSSNGNNRDRNSQNDKSCVVHCFFEELDMLNKHDFPDKHKVIYVLTRDIRGNELREFYTDSIQECFRFLEMEQRTDKCQFSRNLINCMAEYAKANCEDWYNHTMIFNSN